MQEAGVEEAAGGARALPPQVLGGRGGSAAGALGSGSSRSGGMGIGIVGSVARLVGAARGSWGVLGGAGGPGEVAGERVCGAEEGAGQGGTRGEGMVSDGAAPETLRLPVPAGAAMEAVVWVMGAFQTGL